MVSSKAKTVEEYLSELPPDRKETIFEIRRLILRNLPDGYQESMNWGMITYEIPLERYSDTYNGQPLGYLALAAQKNYNSLYLMCVYMDTEREQFLMNAFRETGKKPNMGKSCIRFKETDDLPLEAIGKLIADVPPDEFIQIHEDIHKK